MVAKTGMAKAASDPGVLETGKTNAYPVYAPRFWHGMRVRPYFRLMAANRFRVHPFRIPMAIGVAGCTLLNSSLARVQHLMYERRIRDVKLATPPIFIIGHWRSGTTYLHELLSLDDRFTCPTTYECFAPDHFLVSGRVLPRMLGFLLPSKRPMDDMAVGFDRPQEDEFALCAMGAPTPMLRMAFPNHPTPYMELLDMDEARDDVIAAWRGALDHFIRSVTLLRPDRRLVLKSPPHTGRIRYLAEMYPGARFIHLARHPYKLFPSTLRLWRALDEAQGFQIPRHKHLEQFVYEACERMYRGYQRQRPAVADEQIYELRYEDLVQDPISEIKKIYEHLQLGHFAAVQGKIEAFCNEQREYRPARYRLEPQLEERIRDRWSFYFERYGYTEPAVYNG